MTPRHAVKIKDICRLHTDNHDTSEGWIIIDKHTVIMSTQRNGQDRTGKVEFSRRQFNALIDWYNRDQKK